MTDQSLVNQVPQQLPQLPLGSQQPKTSIIDDLFDLTASRDLDIMLGKALRMTIRILGAEAGSILFQAKRPRTIQSGAFRPEAVVRIERWEEVISHRIQENTWNISSSRPFPVSVFTMSDSRVVLVNAPLLQDTKVVGSLSLILPPGGELSETQHSLVKRIAKGLGQNASLIAELELANNRLRQLSVFYDVGQALVTTFDIDKLLVDTMELSTSIIDAGAASIMLLNEERDELVFRVSHGSGQALRHQRIPIDEGLAGWVARHGRPVIANDARADERFSHRVDVRTGFLTQSIAAVPLTIKGRIIGVLEVLNKYSGEGFDEEDIQLMASIATQAAIAIENARLYQQLSDERDNLIKIQDDNRHQLAENLEDGSVQLLSAINMGLDHLERLSLTANPDVVQNQIGALRNLVQQAKHNTHNLLFELHPVVLNIRGLAVACEQYVTHLRRTESFTIHLNLTEETIPYKSKVTRTIFAIMQQALQNVKHHAKADNVWLSIGVKHNQFIMTIRDDGQGFDINELDKQSNLGILFMKERAASIQAELRIEARTSAPDQGTVVQLVLPWSPQSVRDH